MTDRLPKPLIEIGGQPLILHHLRRLAAVGIREVVINTAYRGEQIQEALGTGARYGVSITYSPETPGALDTGGGIANALDRLGETDFLLVNADVLTDFPFARLRTPAPGHALSLVLVDNPRHHPDGDFSLVGDRLGHGPTRLTYAGIGRFAPALFASRRGQRFGLRTIIDEAIANDTAAGCHHRGRWIDVGRAHTLARARQVAG